LAAPVFYLYAVAVHYFKIVQTSVYKRKTTSAQDIEDFIKKAAISPSAKTADFVCLFSPQTLHFLFHRYICFSEN